LKFNWIKLGRIIEPGKYKWIKTNIQNPFQEHVEGDIFKIHFAGRDKNNYSRGGYVLLDIKNPHEIISWSKTPTIDIGKPGCFDDCGAMPSCIVNNGDKKYMYYTGWTQKVKTPFAFYIGLAVSEDNGKTYKKYSQIPILDRSENDPFMTASPFVIKENNIWRMWYVSCIGWQLNKKDWPSKHYYHIKYAESRDGLKWTPKNIDCIFYKKQEYAIARPVVYKEDGLYKMWYCYRGGKNTYRAGYAESKNGLQWIRKDNQVGIDVSSTGWDSEMICYPCVFEHRNQKYMLYNGNDYGKTGCGLALLEKI